MLPALSLDGIIGCKIVEGSFNGELFHEFVQSLLERMNPYPLPNSVLVMDNCRIHKNPALEQMVKER